MRLNRCLLGLEEIEQLGARWMSSATAALLLVAATLLLLQAPPAAAQTTVATPDVERMPGYVAFDARSIVGDAEPSAEITVNKLLLGMALSAARESQPDLAESLSGIDLDLVTVRVYEDADMESESAVAGYNRLVNGLLSSGWSPIVRVPTERVNVLMRAEGNRIQGFTVLVAQDEVVFINVVLDMDANQFGTEVGQVLNKVMTGQIDPAQILAMIQHQQPAPPPPNRPTEPTSTEPSTGS